MHRAKAKSGLAAKEQGMTCGALLDIMCLSLDPVFRSERSLTRYCVNLLQFMLHCVLTKKMFL